MDIPENKLAALTCGVLAKLDEFASRLKSYFPSILCDVGHYSNEAFLLRSFVSLRSDNDGEELAMSVDITAQLKSDANITISIESDLCLDDGTIVATGPSAEFEASSPGVEVAISSWNKEFDAFLRGSEVEAVNVLRMMISRNSEVSHESKNS